MHWSNVEEKPMSSHNVDDGNSMDAEVKALKGQLKRIKQDATKLKKQISTLKTMLVLSWLFFVILGSMLFKNLKMNDAMSLP